MVAAGELATTPNGDVGAGAGHDGWNGEAWIDFYASVARTFLESYRVAARGLTVLQKGPASQKDFVKRALAVGERMFLAGEIERPEAVTRPTIGNAYLAFADQGYVSVSQGKISLAESFATPAAVAAIESKIAGFSVDRGRALIEERALSGRLRAQLWACAPARTRPPRSRLFARGSVGTPTHGALSAAAELPMSGPGFRWFNPMGQHYGVPRLVEALAGAAAEVERLRPGGAPLMVGDLSRRTGGRIPHHASHRIGPRRRPPFLYGDDRRRADPEPRLFQVRSRRSRLRSERARRRAIRKARSGPPMAAHQSAFERSAGERAVDVRELAGRSTHHRLRARAGGGLRARLACRNGHAPAERQPSLTTITCTFERPARPDEAVAGCEGGGPYWPWLPPLPTAPPEETDEMLAVALLSPIETGAPSAEGEPLHHQDPQFRRSPAQVFAGTCKRQAEAFAATCEPQAAPLAAHDVAPLFDSSHREEGARSSGRKVGTDRARGARAPLSCRRARRLSRVLAAPFRPRVHRSPVQRRRRLRGAHPRGEARGRRTKASGPSAYRDAWGGRDSLSRDASPSPCGLYER